MLTPKENLKRLFDHEETEFLPIMGEGIINNVPINGYHERPMGTSGGKDWFGVNWTWPEGEPAPMPSAPYLMEEACEWQDALTFPDLEAVDWEEAARLDRIPEFDRENNLLYQMIHNGLTERLQQLMGFENALVAMVAEPEDTAELLEALTDYKCALIDKIAKYYRPDIICYHDDWGTQRGLFFSPDTWRSLIKEPTRRIVEHVHSKGIRFELHSDGLIKDLIPEIVEDLKVDSLNIMNINGIPELKKQTGNRVVYNVFLDTQKLDVIAASGGLTEEQLRAAVHEEVIANAAGGCYIPMLIMVRPEWEKIILDELHVCREELMK